MAFQLDRLIPNASQEKLFAIALPYQFILFGMISPVVEEILFRGILFTLLRRIAGESLSAILISAVFAVFHGNILQMLYAFPIGLVLQYLMKKSRTILTPIACHSGANITSIVVEAIIR